MGWISSAAVTKQQLQNGFTGYLRDAKCSVPADGNLIREEIASSYSEDIVDKAVAAVIRMGMVTAHLRQADELAGPLGDVSIWGIGFAWAALGFLAVSAGHVEAQELYCRGKTPWEVWLMLFQGLCWTIVVVHSPPDRLAFATGSLKFLGVPFI